MSGRRGLVSVEAPRIAIQAAPAQAGSEGTQVRVDVPLTLMYAPSGFTATRGAAMSMPSTAEASARYHYDGSTEWAALLRELERECPDYRT